MHVYIGSVSSGICSHMFYVHVPVTTHKFVEATSGTSGVLPFTSHCIYKRQGVSLHVGLRCSSKLQYSLILPSRGWSYRLYGCWGLDSSSYICAVNVFTHQATSSVSLFLPPKAGSLLQNSRKKLSSQSDLISTSWYTFLILALHLESNRHFISQPNIW